MSHSVRIVAPSGSKRRLNAPRHTRRPRNHSRGPDDIVINLTEATCSRGHRVVMLTPIGVTFLALCAASPKLLREEEAMEALYGDDPDGGPETGRRLLDRVICYLRGEIEAIGIAVQTVHGRGHAFIVGPLPSIREAA